MPVPHSTYSMGLRLEEALSLQVGDIDAGRKRVHARRGKGHKDRLVPLPDLTYEGLRELWKRHRHPMVIISQSFPTPNSTVTLLVSFLGLSCGLRTLWEMGAYEFTISIDYG